VSDAEEGADQPPGSSSGSMAAASVDSFDAGGSQAQVPPTWDDEIKSLALAVALKCADLGNLAAPSVVNKRWVQHLEEEYFRQGDREKASNLPVSALMDRSKAGVSKSQTGFFGVVGLPLFRSFVKAFPGARPMLEAAEANFYYWRGVEEEARRRVSSKQLSLSGTTSLPVPSGLAATTGGVCSQSNGVREPQSPKSVGAGGKSSNPSSGTAGLRSAVSHSCGKDAAGSAAQQPGGCQPGSRPQ